MKADLINPFLSATSGILAQLNINDIRMGKRAIKEMMFVNLDVTSVISLVGTLRGNISLSCSETTTKGLISAMMMGMPVETIDSVARSGFGEFTNMVAGNAVSTLAEADYQVDITPPSIITGKNVYFIISQVKTIAVTLNTGVGDIEINIGLEI